MQQVPVLLDQEPVRVGDGDRAITAHRHVTDAGGVHLSPGARHTPNRSRDAVDGEVDELERVG